MMGHWSQIASEGRVRRSVVVETSGAKPRPEQGAPTMDACEPTARGGQSAGGTEQFNQTLLDMVDSHVEAARDGLFYRFDELDREEKLERVRKVRTELAVVESMLEDGGEPSE